MQILSREYFGWPKTQASIAHPSHGLVIHYDGPGNHLTEKPHSACIQYWKGVRDFHIHSNGWLDIGYSFGVCPHKDARGNGYVFVGRGLNREQAAQPTGNTTYYSCTLMLGNGEKPTDIQIQTVRELREYLHNLGNANVVKGHKDFYNTDCPGTVLYKMVKDGAFLKFAPLGIHGKGWPYSKTTYMHETWKDSVGVMQVQAELNRLGYSPKLSTDGDYGPLTMNAVKWYQKKKGLHVDGFVGAQTWTSMFG
jgi:hypothetical protein